MSEHILKAPDTISVTATPQAVTLPETDCWYSIRNSGSGSVYYIAIDISDYTAATYTSKTAAQLRTAGCGMISSGASTSFQTDMPTIYLVCANGVTATANIEPGIMASAGGGSTSGNVGLLNVATDQVNPATSDLQTTGNAILTTMDADTGNIATAVQLIDDDNESRGQTIIYADLPANATVAATPEEVIAAVALKKFYILELALTFTVQDVVRILDTTATPVYRGSYQVASYGGFVLPRNANDKPHFVTTAGANLGIVTAATNSYSGHIIYYNAV